MSRKWTTAQSAAIDTRDKSLLVCAAAGSGKTATLTERIISSLTDKEDPVDIDRMLIVTFTRAAATELKQRISASLSDALAKDPQNKRLSEEIIKMSSADICTIDAFYLNVIRKNFDKLGISPSFRTADTAELDVVAKSLMEDSIDKFYEERGDDFSKITECFVNVRNGENLANIFLYLYSRSEAQPEGVEFIKLSAEKAEKDSQRDFFEGSFGSIICTQLTEKFEYYKNVFEDFMDCDSPLSSLPALIYDKQFAEKFIDLLRLKSYEECQRHINSYTPIKLPSLSRLGIDNAEDFKNIRNKFKKYVSHVAEHTFGFSSTEIKEVLLRTADLTYSLYDLLCDFRDRFEREKKQKNVLSFSDIRRHAMELLVDKDGRPTKVALEYAEKYKQIYIDEYQDVDRVQDIIFRSIASPTARFMVGDIKQSIYGFRGAEPSVFASYRKSFPDINSDEALSSNEASIFMSNNFRCDRTVIDFANCVCSYVFSECADSMGYTAADDLICSKIVEDRQIAELPTELTVIVPDTSDEENDEDGDDAVEVSNKELEAKYIANKIRELLKDGKKADGSPVMPHDIAVLFRSSAMGEYVSRALSKLGIACSNETDSNYFENPDVLLVLCLLNVIDNPQRDVYLAGLLRSPFFNFTLDELIRIRRSADASFSLYDALLSFSDPENDEELLLKCRAFCDTLSDLRNSAASLSVDKLLRHLYSSELFVASGLVNADESNNLLHLYEYARNFEASSFKGLYNFIVYVNRLIEKKTKFSFSSATTNEGKVSLMTIHKSKGLEFPICFVCNTASPFNLQETRESLVCVANHGIAMKISDGSGYARLNTPMRDALVEAAKTLQVEEEMRVLYVALTRARERLFVTASTSTKKEALLSKAEHARAFKCAHTVRSASSYLDWILSAVDPEIPHDFCSVSFVEKSKISDIEEMASEKTEKNIDVSDGTCEILRQRFSFVYPYKEATQLPAKISVSSLLDHEKDDDTLELFDTSSPQEYTVPHILEEKKEKEKASAAKRGTATHLFLQFCDFGKAKRNGVTDELCRLIEKKFIPKESEELVFRDELSAFFESELYEKIRAAKRIIREQRFNILLPPEVLRNDPEFIRETEGEFLAVQGVIDLIIEDEKGDLFLYDYKTDRLSPAELSSYELLRQKMTERHAPQLRYYKEAVRRLFGKECKAAYIYSTHAAREIEI